MYKVGYTDSGNILVEMTPREWEAVTHLFWIKAGITISLDEELARYRKSRGLTQAEVAERLNISKSYVSRIERGLAKNVSTTVQQRIIDLVQQK